MESGLNHDIYRQVYSSISHARSRKESSESFTSSNLKKLEWRMRYNLVEEMIVL